MKIFIFGDDQSSIDITKLLFTQISQNLVSACAIGQAEKIISKEKPDVILMDLSSKNPNALQLCTRIRSMTQIPIIVLSVMDEPKFIAGILNSGADDFISKPVSTEILDARINTLIRRSNSYFPPVSAYI